MGHSGGGVRPEDARERVPQARELGWDDSLYEGEGPPPEGAAPRDPAPRDTASKDTAGGGGGGATPPVRPRRRLWRVLRWSAASLSLLILVTAGAGYWYYEHLNGNIRSGERSGAGDDPAKARANAAGQTPLNILLLGSDSRSDPENVKLGGGKNLTKDPPLADVQMLVHISADRKNASVVSIPRDTRVSIPKCEDAGTGTTYPQVNTIINESLGRGGAGCTLATWQKLTGLYIDHWMTIDFAGVVKMADAIGGVDVCVKDNVWDRPRPGVPGGSGLKLTKGTHQVKGEQALQWLRTRHAFASDLGRAQAQHMYMNSMIRHLTSQNVFTDTPRLTGLAEAATKSLEVSKEIGTVKKLFDLAMQLKSVPTDRITMTTMPTETDPRDPNHLVARQADADTMWSMLREDVPFDSNGDKADAKAGADARKKAADQAAKTPSSAPADTGVTVRNGTGGAQTPVRGRAAEVTGVLSGKGYTLASAATELTPQEKTTVGYPSAELEGDAQAVAKALGIPLTSVKRSTDVSGVTVTVGADWRTGSAFPKSAEPEAGSVPDTADALNGSEKDACMDVYKPYRF
ncbi:LCP family protein [Streptomyces corynorhini]|uniref:LytR family transcriptional regulator n=1 Tax=Streptomyces corynorhini TaxID=2282652 RepID=A0A370BIT4_9ACTN|nr:LCP family protein [Streptomyces corynorhini]RDG39556.1 LytR family transcriptional regulator [Streptomyces corynorhini]